MIVLATVLASLGLASLAPPPVPPPIEQHVANCAQPTYASDQLICGDEQLLALDRELASLLPLPVPDDGPVIEEQADWFKRSRMCASQSEQRACLTGAYRERIAVAQSLHHWEQTPSTWQKAKCKKRTVVELSVLPNATMKIRMGEQVWLALTSAQQDSWVPYSWVSQDRVNIEIHVPEAKVMKCRVES